MCRRVRENFCKLFLLTAGTTPTFGHGLRVGYGYLEEDFQTRVAPVLPRAATACERNRRARENDRQPETAGQRKRLHFSRAYDASCGSLPLEICEGTVASMPKGS